ncbi:biotin transport system substrate-specific component [Actinopolyspora xinjiangensis]|uniref:Biotin transporter n=1 Tax=Actinopolyspora xinjiangensis TaxID=405564 RepID=A0A1H0W2F8_9ACTN|nr:biotin transporter BioY [Actinopolyspora xinjiangensis]SDP84907.1 biotin transport system substrate-specific component [Actinopolyspora xinjiangensis]
MSDSTPQRSATRHRQPAADLARIVVFAAFIAVLGTFPGIYLAGAAAPIVLQNLGPLLSGSLLGPRRGTASVVLFLTLVALGLPLLSGGRGGIAPFFGPSAGFLFGWILSALVVGLIVFLSRKPTLPVLLVANLAGIAVDYLVGLPVMAAVIGDFRAAGIAMLRYVPGDLAKVVVVSLVAAAVHRAFPNSTPRKASTAR